MDKKYRASMVAVALMVGTMVHAQSFETVDYGDKDPRSCTSIVVGKAASTDGSVITSHTCDGDCRTWMQIVPARDYEEGATTPIFEGRMWTQWPTDSTKIYRKGEIPQVRHTYRYLDTAYPAMNEKQLGIGETTIFGQRWLQNKKAMFYIEELERIVLERCSTAREAILLMGDLVKKYGFADTGECLTVADKNEVWYFEIFGEGPDNIGGVWAAVRIPDDEVAVSANIPRIGTIDRHDKSRYLYSDNLFDVAKKLKLWDGKEEFVMWKVYGGKNLEREFRNFNLREFFILNELAPSLHLDKNAESLPLSVKPDKKVSAAMVSSLLGSTYEGSEFAVIDSFIVPNPRKYDWEGNVREGEPDSIVSPMANPWMRKEAVSMYNSLGGAQHKNMRTVSMPWCAYSTVIQLRSWLPDEVGGVAWVSIDNPGESPRFPIFAGNTTLPDMLGVCGQRFTRDDAALIHYRKANRLATVRWGESRLVLEPARDYFTEKGLRELPFVEQQWQQLNSEDPKKAEEMLDGYTADFIGATIMKWDDMARFFWKRSGGGF